MFKHIVMWKLKPFAEGASKYDNALKIKNLLESLREKIKMIEHIEVGIDCAKTDSSFDVVLYSEFLNQEAYENYQNHPERKRVGEFISKVRETRIVVDYDSQIR